MKRRPGGKLEKVGPRKTCAVSVPLLEFRAIRAYRMRGKLTQSGAIRKLMQDGNFDDVVEEQRRLEEKMREP